MSEHDPPLNLKPFRRRIRLLRVSRCAAIGGAIGAGGSVVLAGLDMARILYVEPLWLTGPVAVGTAAGAARALAERLSDDLVARSVDRRAALQDRLTTAAEVLGDGELIEAQHRDAAARAAGVDPARLYPLRPGRWHGVALLLCAAAASIFLMGNTTLLRTSQQKKDAAEMKRAAVEVERISRPVLAEAARRDAGAQEKRLARDLTRFQRDLARARLSRAEALQKANDLAEKARELEEKRAESLAKSLQGARTAAERIEEMARQAGIPRAEMDDPADAQAGIDRRTAELDAQTRSLSETESALSREAARIARQLAEAGKSGLSERQRKMLEARLAQIEKKLAAARAQLAQVKLSHEALEFLKKLAAQPEYQEAMRLLAKLQANAKPSSAAPKPMTPEELREAAKRLEESAKALEEMARAYNDDAKLKELARRMRDAARAARLGKGVGQDLLMACGLGGGFNGGNGTGGFSTGSAGRGGRSNDRWIGPNGTLQKTDESSLLNVKFEDRVLNSQQGREGPQTYTDVIGPSSPAGKSAVPYEKVLPRYEKSAESAMEKSEIPPAMRGRVREYFESLRR